ncbi:hypothetical protein STEG23_005803 [Scotinomys teguina]
MARKYFYFDLDYYGVGFCEEEIPVEAEQMEAISVGGGCYGKRAAGVLPEQGVDAHLSGNNYKKSGIRNTEESVHKPEEEELEEAKNMAHEQPSLLSSPETIQFHTLAAVGTADGISRNLLPRCPQTICDDELSMFKYIVSLKELAELMNVDEQKVKTGEQDLDCGPLSSKKRKQESLSSVSSP